MSHTEQNGPIYPAVMKEEYGNSVQALLLKRQTSRSIDDEVDRFLFMKEHLIMEKDQIVVNSDLAMLINDPKGTSKHTISPPTATANSPEDSLPVAPLSVVYQLMKHSPLTSVPRTLTPMNQKLRNLTNELTEEKLEKWRKCRYKDFVESLADKSQAAVHHTMASQLVPYENILLDFTVYHIDGYRKRKVQELTCHDLQGLCNLKDVLYCAELSLHQMKMVLATKESISETVATTSKTTTNKHAHTSGHSTTKRLPASKIPTKVATLPQDSDLFFKRKPPASGYFFMQGSYYNDMRTESCIDYSRYDNSTTKFSTFKMEETRFCDLPSLTLNAPIRYIHEGDCEHEIILTSARLTTPSDELIAAFYPLLKFVNFISELEKRCRMCKLYVAAKVSLNDSLADTNPCYLCEQCFDLLHKSEDGVIIDDVNWYPYIHP